MTKVITVIMWVYYICWIIPCWSIGQANRGSPLLHVANGQICRWQGINEWQPLMSSVATGTGGASSIGRIGARERTQEDEGDEFPRTGSGRSL